MGSEAWELERRYSVPGVLDTRGLEAPASEDLHAWSIYRQNLNSDFTDSALGSAEKSPLPYGNFQLRHSTVQSILRHPRYGPKSPLANNSYTYLKFGLPRVLPPACSRSRETRDAAGRDIRDASSGYDSSEEGRRASAILRCARSDPDFATRNSARSQNPRLRSVSEANLLFQGTPLLKSPGRRHSIAPLDPGYLGESILYPSVRPGVEGYAVSPVAMSEPVNLSPRSSHHPHLQLRGIETTASDGSLLLRGVTLEVWATELLAIMATTEREGTEIVETIAGRKRISRGEILLNGRSVSSRILRSRVAYLPAECDLTPGLTVQQTLNLYVLLRGGTRISRSELETVLLELGLEATKHCLVNTLTTSEARRLALACRLLQDARLLALDRPTHGLDIFDAFFLVEYLRQWATREQRLVTLSLHPPTYEILTMISRIALTSGGRIMYSGPRRDMLPYFALAEFPCPSFKNPSDYYLDLVTLDDLSAEAMLESSQRIDHLAELAKTRLPSVSNPGPPGALPPAIPMANPFIRFYGLLFRTLIYGQPLTMAKLLQKIVVSASLSIVLGAIFWNVARDSNLRLRDRIGFYYASLSILCWPLSLLAMREIACASESIERDIRDGLYGRFSYILAELLCSLPSWCLVYLVYLAPAFAMSGLHLVPDENLTSLWNYLAIGAPYLMLQHLICTLFAHLWKSTYLAALCSGIVIAAMSLTGGVTLHLGNFPAWCRKLSPLRWVLSTLLLPLHEFDSLSKLSDCKPKQVQRQDIIFQTSCEPPDGSLALREVALDELDLRPEPWLGIGLLVLVGLIVLGFLCISHSTMPKTSKSLPNKP